MGAIIFFGRGWVPNLQKVSINKIATHLPFRQQKFYDSSHHRYTLPSKQATIVLKSVFLNKINTLRSSCDPLHLGHQKFYDTPYFSFHKIMTPPSIFGTPPSSQENDSPLSGTTKIITRQVEMKEAVVRWTSRRSYHTNYSSQEKGHTTLNYDLLNLKVYS